MKNAIVIGASSGIGRELVKTLASNGYNIGITARRLALLTSLSEELPKGALVKQMDVTHIEEAQLALSELISEMNGNVDLIVYCSGFGKLNKRLEWQVERDIIDTNVIGFCGIANTATKYFIGRKIGHFVGISSIAAIRGGRATPGYNASKAFMSSYLQGLRQKVTHAKMGITITDIKPGFVDTDMAQGIGMFWVASPQKAAQQIYNAIRKKKSQAYITRRWRLIAWLLKITPEWFYNRF